MYNERKRKQKCGRKKKEKAEINKILIIITMFVHYHLIKTDYGSCDDGNKLSNKISKDENKREREGLKARGNVPVQREGCKSKN